MALAVALVPCVATVIRAAVRDWMPLGDAAYFTARSRDVFSEHTPFVGAWSSGSLAVDENVNTLGPLQLDLLAPFTNAPFEIISPYLGTAIGSALINAASIVAVWGAARSFLGPRRVVLVMIVTMALIATLGVPWLLDARQQMAMVLPFYALCWVMTASAAGVWTMLPVAVVFASLVVQSHFTFVYQTAIVIAAGLGVAIVGRARHRTTTGREPVRRVVVVTAAVAVVCWIQPLVDQFAGTGNLGRVLGPAREGQRGAGFADGIQVVAGSVLTPPFWLPGSIDGFLRPFDGVTVGAAVVAVVVWLSAAAALIVVGRRVGEPLAALLGGAAAVVIVAAVVAASMIPRTVFGLVQQNYYWMWAIGAFATAALLVGAATTAAARTAPLRRAVSDRRVRPALAVAIVVVGAVAIWPRYAVDTIRRDEATGEHVGRSFRQQLASSFADPSFPDVVELAPMRQFGNQFMYVVIVELQRAGVEVRFPPDSHNLYRFGRSRCAPAGRYPLLRHIGGSDNPVPGAETVAVVSFPADQQLELAVLGRHLAADLQRGTIVVDVDEIEPVGSDSLERLAAIIAGERDTTAGLGAEMKSWDRHGLVDMPAALTDAFARWVALEYDQLHDPQIVVLEPPTVAATDPDAATSC